MRTSDRKSRERDVIAAAEQYVYEHSALDREQQANKTLWRLAEHAERHESDYKVWRSAQELAEQAAEAYDRRLKLFRAAQEGLVAAVRRMQRAT
jgi:hypothetical protein